MKKIILVILLLSASKPFAQPFSKEEKEILEMQDKRDKKVLEFIDEVYPVPFHSQLLDIKNNALLNVVDSTCLEYLIQKYINSDFYYDGSLIIYFLGLIKHQESINFLNKELDKEKNINKLLSIAFALSKIGTENELNKVLQIKNYPLDLNIFEFAKRRISNDNALQYIKAHFNDNPSSNLPKFFSYCLARAQKSEILKSLKNDIMILTKNEFYETRMWSFSALGKLQDTSTIDYMLESLEKENDWRVRVNICNALGNQKLDASSTQADKVCDVLLSHSTDDASTHVSIVALTALGKLFASGIESRSPVAEKIKQSIQFILTPNKAIDWQIKAEAIRVYTKIFKDGVKDELLSLFSQTENYDLKSAIVGSFASMNNSLVYKELRDSISTDVQRYNAKHPNKDGSMIGSRDLAKIYQAFVETLAALDDKLNDENKNIIRLIFSEFSNSKYTPIVDVSLTNLQDSIYLKYRDETCQIMLFDMNELSHTKDADVLILYIQSLGSMKFNGAVDVLKTYLKSKNYDVAKTSADALKNIIGNDFEKEITAPKYRTDFDWDFIDKLNEKRIVTIKTNQGNIMLELYPNIAPFTVQNFVKLAEKKYYDGTVFHRVVPNFVIQGGDPTGTGFGGPGYSIRTEICPLGFEEYTVGMASSGKDTEGSQFFITHSPQPHLDGRYTMFGRVIEGKNVVDKIQVGDKIESITFSK